MDFTTGQAMKIGWILMGWLVMQTAAAAAVTARDDAGHVITLAQPAQRVVSLAPHATELLFAAGAAERVVGVLSHSDFPAEAKRLPVVGDSRQIDIERLLALKPDLLVVWLHGSSARQLEQLQQLGIPLFYSEPHKLDEIPDAVVRLGQLLGTDAVAAKRAAQLRQTLSTLTARYAGRPTVRVFYQVWSKPLYTLNGRHIVSDAIRVCGGENIFDRLATTAPIVNIEAVLQANPEAIVTGSNLQKTETGLALWQDYPALLAVKNNNLFAIDADLLNRAGPRLIDGTAALCEKLDSARNHRSTTP
ncbi:cobalamin-binding protein [Actimicrobium sp. CCC2.4]|uniref:cobalamin-binding protein n=1 Tax=Actimicrobium sp. CCC2.4 TaxID=3048606 RepID=UPI002AC92CDD|nr:cobalamin-binding protein [Actimicrobium sp. CCC2.4]WPX33903.1 cobalamin-binding protein [Actimicrobium sp. CCC2.4]